LSYSWFATPLSFPTLFRARETIRHWRAVRRSHKATTASGGQDPQLGKSTRASPSESQGKSRSLRDFRKEGEQMSEQRPFPQARALHDRFGRRVARDSAIEIDNATARGRTALRPPFGIAEPRIVPSARPSGMRAGQGGADVGSAGAGRAGVSDPEIAQLVSAALESAMLAFRERNPEQFLHSRAAEARVAVEEALASVADLQAADPLAQVQYRKAAVLPDVVCRLAREMVYAISCYAGALDEETAPSDG
jgi:hypothetical protein